MTFATASDRFARRFLTDRSFELIVSPALADLEYDTRQVRARLAVIRALAGAACEDAVRGASFWTFLGLVLMPLAYYTALFVLLTPVDIRAIFTLTGALSFALILLAMGLVPALACIWPEPPSEKAPREQQ